MSTKEINSTISISVTLLIIGVITLAVQLFLLFEQTKTVVWETETDITYVYENDTTQRHITYRDFLFTKGGVTDIVITTNYGRGYSDNFNLTHDIVYIPSGKREEKKACVGGLTGNAMVLNAVTKAKMKEN